MQDAFKPVNAWVANGITWLDDIQQFYRERSVIEKEYSAKLNALAKKYYEKKAKKSSSLSVGDTPAMTPGSLERYGLLVKIEDKVADVAFLQCFPHHMDYTTHNCGESSCGTRPVWIRTNNAYCRAFETTRDSV